MRKAIPVMKIGFAVRMRNRPVAFCAACFFDDSEKAHFRNWSEINRCLETEFLAFWTRFDLRRCKHFEIAHPFAVLIKPVRCPFARRREIEFQIGIGGRDRSKEFKTAFCPKSIDTGWLGERWPTHTANIAARPVIDLEDAR